MLDLQYNGDSNPNPQPIFDRPDDPIRVAIYARVSSDGQDINNSVQKQIEQCEKYAREHNMVVVAIYVDEAITGRSDNRPRFQEMVSDTNAKEKPFDVILVWKFGRFARHRVDSAIYKNRLKKRGVRIVSIQEKTDDTPSGRLMENIIEDIDEFYSDNLSEEVRYGQRKVAERGYWPGNRAPYGYTLQKVQEENGNAYHNMFVIDPVAAPIVRRIIAEAKAGHSQTEIRDGLNEDGIPPPEPFVGKTKSEKWACNTISDIVHERKYTGLIIWGESSKSGLPPVVAPGRHEAIVCPDDLAEAARVMASKVPQTTHPRRSGSIYILSELLVCRNCDKRMGVRPSKNQSSRYQQCWTRRHYGVEACKCPNLNVRKTEEAVLSAVLNDILCPSNVQQAMTAMAEELTGPYEEQNSRIQTIEKELTDVTNRQARVMDAYEDGTYTAREFTKRITPLRQREADLRQHLTEATRDIEHQTALLAKPEEILAFTTQVADFIKHSPPKETKQMLKRFIKCIWIEPGKGTIVYRIPLPSDAKRPKETELILDLDDPVPPINRVPPHTRG